jgi:hypothetical protein
MDWRDRRYCIVLSCIVLHCIILYCIVLYCIVLYCIVLYCIVLYCIVLYCIVLYSIFKDIPHLAAKLAVEGEWVGEVVDLRGHANETRHQVKDSHGQDEIVGRRPLEAPAVDVDNQHVSCKQTKSRQY